MAVRWLVRILCSACLLLAWSTTAAAESDWDYWQKRRHMVYLTGGFGSTNVLTADQGREVEGIAFQFTTKDTGLGGAGMAGYWITDNVGLEAGYWDFGAVHVPFDFQDPHDNTSGTGESRMHFTGWSFSLMFGYDVGPVQVFGRLGANLWKQKMGTRFDIPDEPAVRRELSDSGMDLTYGAGVSWRFHRTWSLQAQYERTHFDQDKIDMLMLSVSYDFLGLILR